MSPGGVSPGGGTGDPQALLEALPRVGDVVWALLSGARRGARILFTAPEDGAGTALLAAAAAIGLAQRHHVAASLIEADLGRPELAAWLRLPERGLSDVLDRRAELASCVHEPPGCAGLRVLLAGRAREPVAGEFAGKPMEAALDELSSGGRHLLLAAPSIVTCEEARRLLPRVDGALLVLRAGTSRKPAARRAVELLKLADVPLLGSILKDWRPEPGVRPLRRRAPLATLAPPAVPAAAPAPPPAAPPAPRPAPAFSQSEHDRQVEILERRLAKLNRRLAQAEEALKQLAALKGEDAGIASVYRGIQGLSSEEDYLTFKRELMHKIFLANLELQQARARRP